MRSSGSGSKNSGGISNLPSSIPNLRSWCEVLAAMGRTSGGGGTKEMLLRAIDAAIALAPADPRDPPSRFAQSAELATALRRSFETIALAKVSTSAAEARSLGLLAPTDRITMNRERLLLDAKAQAATLAGAGYT